MSLHTSEICGKDVTIFGPSNLIKSTNILYIIALDIAIEYL